MSETRGFIDLRVGSGTGGVGDDSVWPSFTDIMTVIVMIFLMALVVIMVRNFELDRELISTTTAKDAVALANQDLVRRLIQIEHTLDDSKTEKDVLEANLSVALKRLSALLLQQQALKTDLEAVTSEQQQLAQAKQLLEQQQQADQLQISTLTKNEQALSRQIENLLRQLSTLKLQFSEQIAGLTSDKQLLDREILALMALIEQRTAENTALQAQATTSGRQFRSLQEEYEALDAKYRKLIRPARSTAGKQVVTVWIEKAAVGLQYKMKQPHQSEPHIVNPQQLHRTLQALKAQFGNLLYVKVVIPKESGLLYEEAASATQDILQKYDYYSQ